MNDDLLPFELPVNNSSIIKVLGVGGGGSNAVNHMYKQGIEGVDFIISNTDYQALSNSPVPVKIQLGATLTEGLGAGNKPDKGREAAIESIEEIKIELGENTKMVFITAGMGGGTGTGAAPVIAEAAKELGVLTVGIVTIPFRFEGRKRINQAIEGIQEMKKHVDSLLIVNNEKLREMFGDFEAKKAFGKADDVLTTAAKGIAEIITKEGHINVDFADVKTVMADSGISLMGSGEAEGDNRAEKAVKDALSSPLLDNNDITGAKDLLLNISSGNKEATMDEIGLINEFVQEEAGNNADLIWGSSIDKTLGDKISVTVIATGFGTSDIPEIFSNLPEPKVKKNLLKNETNDNSVSIESKEVDKHDDVPFEIETSNNTENIIIKDKTESVSKPEFSISEGIKLKKLVDSEQEIYEETTISVVAPEQEETDFNTLLKRKKYKEFVVTEYADNVNEYENIPAYLRKKIQVNVEQDFEGENISRYTLSGNGEEIKLSENNPYLHDKAD